MFLLFYFTLVIYFPFYPIAAGKRIGETYERKVGFSHHAVFDPEGHFHLTWIKDSEAKEIEFTVQIKTTGWFGFGISPNGGMINSDIVIGFIDDYGVTHFHVISPYSLFVSH